MTFTPGTAVTVRDDWPETRGPAHIRTPHFVRGKSGTVVRHLGDFPNPEDIAFERPAPLRSLYRVAFDLKDLWSDATGEEMMVEIYEHWLEARPR